VEEFNDRDTKKPKPLSSDELYEEAKENPSSSESSEGKPKPWSSDTFEAKGKHSLIDDYANPNNEFGD